MIKGRPCKVLETLILKAGKHGHGKIIFTAEDIFTGKKLENVVPISDIVEVPFVTRTEWEIIDIGDDGELTLMDEDGNQKTDLNLPEVPENMADEIRDAWAYGENLVYVTVLAAIGREQVCEYVVG